MKLWAEPVRKIANKHKLFKAEHFLSSTEKRNQIFLYILVVFFFLFVLRRAASKSSYEHILEQWAELQFVCRIEIPNKLKVRV